MMNLTSFVNDVPAFSPALAGERVVRLVLHYDENPDTPPPFTVLFQETPNNAAQRIRSFTMQQAGSTRFQVEMPIAEILLTNGGTMSWAVNDALGNLEGQWGGGAELLPQTVQGGFQAQLRTGDWRIKDFTVLTGIERLESGLFAVYDIDFVNTQLLSMKQGAEKMRRIA